MPVSDELACPLLRVFGRLEYQLKRRSRFIRVGPRDAMVDWTKVQDAVVDLPHDDFLAQMSATVMRKVLGGARDRPRVQVVEVIDGRRRRAHFVARNLDAADARALVQATRRVRNNLFHGGKEDPGEQPFDGDDDEWAQAALDIATVLLELVEQGRFGPPEP